ncbi:MAG TPA: aldose epimerase [Firmicutes bacterium]|jgi:galactose mutarotase-like enzyme|nr:aldose epimerase [Bacillota bacterium]
MDKLLSNQNYAATLSSNGAELVSFKKLADHCEYIWNGDKTFWTSHSPLLFPIVCALRDGEMKVDGTLYKMGNHGFTRKSEFQLVEETNSKAVYKLSWSEATLAMYPFQFNLFVTYTLNENRLQVEYRVENIGEKTMYFQIGTHPAFNCPLDGKTNFEDYAIEFESAEKLERLYMNSANVIISGKSKKVELENDKILHLNHDMFLEGAMVFRKIHSEKVTLRSGKTDKKVVLTYHDLPAMGIWQAKNAPFICMEPWHGIADTDDFNGEFKDKDLMIGLKKAAVYRCSIMIEIH